MRWASVFSAARVTTPTPEPPPIAPARAALRAWRGTFQAPHRTDPLPALPGHSRLVDAAQPSGRRLHKRIRPRLHGFPSSPGSLDTPHWPEPASEPFKVSRKEADWQAVRRGTVQNEVFEGEYAAVFVDGDGVEPRWCARRDFEGVLKRRGDLLGVVAAGRPWPRTGGHRGRSRPHWAR